MFTNLKIEADKWPWSTLTIAERVDQRAWVELRDTIPGIMPQNGISSGHDVRFTFKDSYIDLCRHQEQFGELSEHVDALHPDDYLA